MCEQKYRGTKVHVRSEEMHRYTLCGCKIARDSWDIMAGKKRHPLRVSGVIGDLSCSVCMRVLKRNVTREYEALLDQLIELHEANA